MARRAEGRYWVYKHDSDDNIIESLGFFDDLEEAIDAAVDEGLAEDGYDKTVRVVDNELNDGTTVWKAGPHNWKEENK